MRIIKNKNKKPIGDLKEIMQEGKQNGSIRTLSDYQTFIHQSRYARWLDDEYRRETWEETVGRFVKFLQDKVEGLTAEEVGEIYYHISSKSTMPSMRALMTAGPALDRDNVAAYNCAYKTVDHPRVFDEIMYILMCGTGVGFSCERQYINKLPEIPEALNETDTCIRVSDSKNGWATAYKELIGILYSGSIPKWDCSRVRPAGARLKTFGGRASGPEPLEDLFRFTVEVFQGATSRRLNSIEVHDIICKIADIVVVGGVRRSALISLSNLTDERMRVAKSGQWWESNPQRKLANNSVCYTEKPDINIFLKEMTNLYESKSGERGIFYRGAAQAVAGRNGRRDPDHEFGTNPCSEIILRDGQFCNLTEVIARPGDSYEDLRRKVRVATIIGTIQSTFTNFRYLRPVWKRNCEEERLLGVSITGIMDHPVLNGSTENEEDTPIIHWLDGLKEVAIETNKEWSRRLGISPSAAITCVKPSGTVSQLVDSSSGIHSRFAPYYVRTVRLDKKDPIYTFLVDQGVPHEDEIDKETTGAVFSFPMKSPDGAIVNTDRGAIEQLEFWKIYATYWCEHKPSITVFVKEEEWVDVFAWVYKNFDILSGVSFLPHTDHIYRQAPYQEITEEEYYARVEAMPEIAWDLLQEYEDDDNTTGSQELACKGGACEI